MAQHKWFHDPIDKKSFEEQMEILKWSEIHDIAYSPYTNTSILEAIYDYWAERDRRKRGRDDFRITLDWMLHNKKMSQELFNKIFTWADENHDDILLAKAIKAPQASAEQVNKIADKGLDNLSFWLLNAIADSQKEDDIYYYKLIEIGENWTGMDRQSPLLNVLADPRTSEELIVQYNIFTHSKAPSYLVEEAIKTHKENISTFRLLLHPNLDLEVALHLLPNEIKKLQTGTSYDNYYIKDIESKLINPFLRSKGYLVKNLKTMSLESKISILNELTHG